MRYLCGHAAPEFMGIPCNQGQQYMQGTGGRLDRIFVYPRKTSYSD